MLINGYPLKSLSICTRVLVCKHSVWVCLSGWSRSSSIPYFPVNSTTVQYCLLYCWKTKFNWKSCTMFLIRPASVAQWLAFLHKNQEVVCSNAGRSKEVLFWTKNINWQALFLKGHTKVRASAQPSHVKISYNYVINI